ncbi:phage holin family protein [Allokutzneria sp. A3M-2-11 16]|uniref:phage holin family protein n=1 Tax=Allokutzneria sp. A3M-2-11 16 TaxID=2962043 RepID=UPI0020B7C51D|nr:phage holin family protein [Allokutzneria sp. A3M-2-11 16]MCP3802462.1 phage holin family protein [Allokutzneria sp. A3M-2-11 16]
MSKTANAEPTTGELVSQLSEQVSRLVRDEMRLAQAELKEKGKRAGMGAGAFGVSGILALYGLAAVFAGIVLLLALGMAPWLAAFVVGAALLLIAGVLALVGKKQLAKAVPPVPEQAIANVRQDITALKEGTPR